MFKSTRWGTIILIFISLSSKAQQIRFVGTAAKKFDGNKIVLYTRSMADSTIIRGGKFNFTIPFEGPTVYHFYSTFENTTKRRYNPLGIMVTDPGIIGIKADVENFENTKVIGSKENELFQTFCINGVLADRTVRDELYKKYGKEMVDNRHPDTANTRVKEMIKDSNRMNGENAKKQLENLKLFVQAHPDSYTSMYFLQGYGSDLGLADYESLYNSLSPKYKHSPAGEFIASDIKKKNSTAIGNVAPDFAEPDATGNMIQLSSFRGKYVLLDFWASWCKPCRAENPNLLAAYNKYKSKNFTVFGVSLDDEKGRKAWLAAMAQDKLPWPQVSELKGFESKAAILYGISAIPTNFLLDPNGKIIAKNIEGKDLAGELAKLLGDTR